MSIKSQKSNIHFWGMLLVGFLSLTSMRYSHNGTLYGISTILWLVVFVYVTKYTETKRQLIGAGMIFVFGYVLRFLGATGIIVADVLVIGILSVFIYGGMLLNRRLTLKNDSVVATLIFPLVWMILYVVSTLLRTPSILRVDFFFFDEKLFIQSEGVISSYGLSFLILWFASLIVHAIRNKSVLALGIAVGILVLAFGIGLLRLEKETPPAAKIKVAYSTGPYVGDFTNYSAITLDEAKDNMKSCVSQAVKQQASILTFNEETYEIDDTDEEELLSLVKEEAKKNNLHILYGLDVTDTDNSHDGKSLNKIVWVDNHGEVLGEYLKYQLVPLVESEYVKGDGTIPSYMIEVDGEEYKVSFAICYDSNFPYYIRQIDDDTDMLFLPSWDWEAVSSAHYRICGAMAVENHVSMIKPTYDGYTIATDAHGRVLTLTNSNDTGYGVVETVDIPVERRNK